ncbi:hypothetical protein AVEN_160535-1 [Araneus ventricosus]|uniref:Uncharacterized protein n=1 Tax=Araneus ventricosus TaxID=182803 RepID=A0A4Y2PF83_ARAVE|nr:hypothetical protein AVEN_160535-1 [Araneus ventricosus]
MLWPDQLRLLPYPIGKSETSKDDGNIITRSSMFGKRLSVLTRYNGDNITVRSRTKSFGFDLGRGRAIQAVLRGKCERNGLGCVSCRLSRYYFGGCPALHAFGGRVRDAVAICGFLESGNAALVAVRVSSSLEIKGDAGFAKHAKGLELHPVQVVERGRVVRKTLHFGRNASRVECLKEQAGNGGFERAHTEENTS